MQKSPLTAKDFDRILKDISISLAKRKNKIHTVKSKFIDYFKYTVLIEWLLIIGLISLPLLCLILIQTIIISPILFVLAKIKIKEKNNEY